MKKIIMTVLIIAMAVSGITVPMRKAEALQAGNDKEFENKITELLGTEDHAGAHCIRACHHDGTNEILYLSDKDGNVIVDDRPMCIEPENFKQLSGMRSSGPTMDGYNRYSIVEGFSIPFKCLCAESYTSNVLSLGESVPCYAKPVDVSWSSDTPDIADVDGNGVITAKKPGKAVIRTKTLASGKEVIHEIDVIKNQQEGVQRPGMVNGKREKVKANYTISYDKNGKAILKFTVKNYGKKKYKSTLYISVRDARRKKACPDALGEVYHSKRKCTLKPGKSKTVKIEIKKLSRLSKSGWYLDLEEGAYVSILI